MQIFTAGNRKTIIDRRASRFSLIELMVVLLIIGIVLGFALPKMGAIPTGILMRQAASEINNSFRAAAVSALVDGTTTRVIFDPENSRINVVLNRTRPEAPAGVADDQVTADPNQNFTDMLDGYLTYDLPPDSVVEFENPTAADHETRPEFHFYPDGEASGPVVLVIIRSRTLRVTVDPLTGGTTIVEVDDD